MEPLLPIAEHKQNVRDFTVLWLSSNLSSKELTEAAFRLRINQIFDVELLRDIADTIVGENPKQAASFRAGNQKVFGFFIGKGFAATNGRANAKALEEAFRDALANN